MSQVRFLLRCALCALLTACSTADRQSVLPTAQRSGFDSFTVSMRRAGALTGDAEAIAILRQLRKSTPGRLVTGIDAAALHNLLARLPEGLAPLIRSGYEEGGNTFFDLVSIRGVPGADSLLRLVNAPRPQALTSVRAAAASKVDVWSAPVVLAMVEPKGTGQMRFTIRRESGPRARDVVILPHDATSEDLEQALRGLALLRRRDGIVPTQGGVTTVNLRSDLRTPSARPAAWVRYLDGLLARVQRADAVVAPGIGWARTIEIKSLGR